MTLPIKILFGILAQQESGEPPLTPHHIQTLCYTGNGQTSRRIEVPGVDLSSSGAGMLIIRCLTSSGDTMAFASWSGAEGYDLSSKDEHEWCAPHRISELGDGYFVLGSEPSWYNQSGQIYSAIAINGSDGAKYFDTGLRDGGDVNYPHSLGIEPKTLWINENTVADKNSYCFKYGLDPEDFTVLLNTLNAATSTSYWNNTRPTTSQYSCTTIYEHVYFAFGDVSGKCITTAYEGNGSSMTIDLGFRPKFVLIKEYDAATDWFWFSEAMEDCDRYHVGTTSTSPVADLVDFVSNGVTVKDSKLTKNVWYKVLAIG